MLKSALVAVDFQNAFFSPSGSFLLRGGGILNSSQIIANTHRLIEYAKKNNHLIIFTRLEFRSDYSDAGLLVSEIAPEIRSLRGYLENSCDSEIIDELLETACEAVTISKNRYDPFNSSNINCILKTNNIRQLYFCGALTNVCVEATVRSAFENDYYVTVVEDATSTYSKSAHEASLATIANHYGKLISTQTLISK